MVRVIAEPNRYMKIVSLKRNSVFYVGDKMPDQVAHLVKRERLISKEIRLVTKKDIVMVVEGLWEDPRTGAMRILFMREDRAVEKAGSLQFGGQCADLALRGALEFTNITRVETVGVLDCVLVYGDEIAVPDLSSIFGFSGWIIKKADAEKYLQLAADRDPPNLAQLVIWHEVHIRPGGEDVSVVRIEGWSEARSFGQEATMRSMTEFVVLFDAKTRVVQQIFLTNAYVAGIPCHRSPIRSIAVGKKLPSNLGLRK